MGWTEERVAELKKLWAEGHSASQIAKRLGSVTRNAVIGKVHRLGLSGRAKAKPAVAARPRKVVKAPQRTTTIVSRGKKMKKQNAALFASIEKRFGVPAELIAVLSATKTSKTS